MTYEQFVFWLKGYIEQEDGTHPIEVEINVIKEKLNSIKEPVGVNRYLAGIPNNMPTWISHP